MTTVPLGELFRARTHTRPSRATNIAQEARQHGDVETNNTTAHPQQGTYETAITSAPTNCTKNAHFSPAKAMAVSIPHTHKQAKATGVSDNQAASPATPRRSTRGRLLAAAPMGGDDTAASQMSHIIYRGHFSRHPKNVVIPTTQIQCLNERWRNCVRNYWLTAIDRWASGQRAEQHQPRRPHRCGGHRKDRRAQKGLAAVPVGGGGARAGLEIDHSERSSRVAISRADRRPPAHTAARPVKAGHAGGRGHRRPETRGATQQQPAPHSNTQCPLTRGLS